MWARLRPRGLLLSLTCAPNKEQAADSTSSSSCASHLSQAPLARLSLIMKGIPAAIIEMGHASILACIHVVMYFVCEAGV